jgi:hypothetical protein
MDIYHYYKELLKLRQSYTHEFNINPVTSVIKDNYIVERELLRKNLYNNILEWLKKYLQPYLKNQNSKSKTKWTDKEINHLLLRYIFNKIITRTDEDDPIFIYKESEIAKEQLKADSQFSNLQFDHLTLMKLLDEELKKAHDTLKSAFVAEDSEVILANDKISYKGQLYNDISKLATKNPEYKSYALALNIRYNYIHLENHGLAREYEKMGFSSGDACECFASAFNHYFDTYCSAFPDLERPFGSIGSFFNQNLDSWNKYIVFVNPPFDESLMNNMFERVIGFMEEANRRRLESVEDTTGKLMSYDHQYVLTVPFWDDWVGLNRMKENKWVYMTAFFKKNELPFINYMEEDNRKLYPSDINELYCSTPKFDNIN